MANLIDRVIQQESGGNPNAVNPRTGASGLMQIMPATAADPGFGVRPMAWDQRFNADANRQFGSDYLGAMLNRYDGDEARALVAYNWGVGNADKWNGDLSSLPAETRGYVQNILGGYSTGGAQSYDDPAGYQIGQPVEDSLTRAMQSGVPEQEAPQAAPVQPQYEPAPQAPEARTGPGYQKSYDSLSRALEQFQKTKAKRRT